MQKKKNKVITINRNRYNDIKKLDHNSMEEYINEIYEKGVEAGLKQAQKQAFFNVNDAMKTITDIKGIGQVKLRKIRNALIAAGADSLEEAAEESERAAGGQQTENI